MTDARTQVADFSWNPLVRIESDEQAAGLARGGVWAAGLVALSYALTIVPLVLSGRVFAFAEAGVATTLATALLALGLAAALAWLLQARTSAIAAGGLLVWIVAETVGGLWLASRGVDATRALGVAVDGFSLILAVQAWRGAWTLRRARPRT